MRYIITILITLNLTLSALEFSFTDLRTIERTSVLQEFKKLYKERKNIHNSMRQALKHARSKSLHKNSISFFQRKNSSYIESYLRELDKVYILELPGDVTNTASLDNPFPGDITDSTSGNDSSAEFIPNQEINNAVRGSIQSPWARR